MPTRTYLSPIFLLFTCLFLFSLPSSSTITSSLDALLPSSGRESGRNHEGLVGSVGSTRSMVEMGHSVGDGAVNSSLVLAAKRTHRRDPLNGFEFYNGGWNISDRHYWASVGFTAAPFFVASAVWFTAFGVCLSIICLCHFCCAREPYGYSRVAYALSLILLILFTIAAIIGCVVLYTGQGKFHGSTTTTLPYVLDQANTTSMKLRNVSSYLAAAKLIGVNQAFLPSNVQTDIDEIETKINTSASILNDKAMDNADNIRDSLDAVKLTLIIIAAVMLLLTFLGFLFSIFAMQFLVYTLVLFGWILVTGTFILSGTFLLLHKFPFLQCVL